MGYAIDFALGGKGTPSYVLLGRHWGDAGVGVAADVAAALTVVGFLIRWWGSSYHRAGVVYSGSIETADLTAAGPYRYTRNPLYLGNLLQGLGIGSIGPPAATIIIVILLTALIYRLIFLEESLLRASQGDAYRAYCAAVPRLFPSFWPPRLPRATQSPNVGFGFITELGSFGFALWMTYLAIAGLARPNVTFVALFYLAIVLFIIGGIANRRMSRGAPARKSPP